MFVRSISRSRPAAMLGQDRVLREELLGPTEQVGGVRVLGHEAQGLPFAPAADHDRHPRPGDRLGDVEEAAGMEQAAVELVLRSALALPHLARDLERVL
jgi:hypothetical protein